MSDKNDPTLPVLGDHGQHDDASACSPRNYVSNEQASVAASMRRLTEHAKEIRQRIENCEDGAEKQELEGQLEDLRSRRKLLVEQREQAIHRKMIMLGHMPPDALI